MLFFIATGVALIVMGVGGYIHNHKQMPFRVYEAGFTLKEVDWRKGFRMEEELVPWDRLRSVELEDRELPGQTRQDLVLRYDDVAGGEAMLKVDPTEVGDLLGMMLALRDTVPDKLGEGIEPFVGTGSEDRVLSVPKGLFVKRTPTYVTIYILIGMCVITGVVGGAGMAQGYSFVPRRIIPAGMLLGVITILVLGLASGGKEMFLRDVNISAQVRGDNIIYPRPWAYRLLLAIRPSLPVGSVRKVLKRLDPISFGHEAIIATSTDGSLRVPYGVFEALEGHPDFHREDRVLLNSRPAHGSDIPIVRPSWPKVVLLWLVLLGIMFVAALVDAMTNGALAGFVKASIHYSVELSVLVLGVAIFSIFPAYLIWRNSRQIKLGKSLEILPNVLRVSKAPKGMREISRYDVVKIWTYDWLIMSGIRLETSNGTLDLPLGQGSKLRKAGYEIIDEPDLVQRELSAGDGMGDREGS